MESNNQISFIKELFAFLKWFFSWGRENPKKFCLIVLAAIAVAISAIAVAGLVIWFFVIHPELILKALAIGA